MSRLRELQEEQYLLQKSRDFITPRRRWAKGKYTAVGPFGFLRVLDGPGVRVRSACAIGATRVCDTWNDTYLRTRVASRLQVAARLIHGPNWTVQMVNDQLGHRAALRLYDFAILQVAQEIERTQAGLNEPSIPIQVPAPNQEPRVIPIPEPAPAPAEEPYEPAEAPEREPVPA